MKKNPNLIKGAATRPNLVKSKTDLNSLFFPAAASEEARDNFNKLGVRQEVITSNSNQNLDIKEMVIPTIFKQNVKNNLKLRPFNDIISDVGDIQYFPAWSKEWRNSVYHYNGNLIKNFPVYDINLVKIIKGYFNIYFNHIFLNYKHVLNRKRRLSFNKIFFARPEIKHTNSKGIVTLYTFNREKIALNQKMKYVSYFIWRLSCYLRSGKGNATLRLPIKRRIISREWLKKYDLLVDEERSNLLRKYKYKTMHWKKFNKVLDRVMNAKLYRLRIRKWVWSPKAEMMTCIEPYMGYLKQIEKFFFRFNIVFIIMKDRNLLQDFYAYFSALKASQIKAKEQANKWVKIFWRREFTIIRKYKFKLNLNKYKFEEKFLRILSNILSKIYSKQIEFNIVNLKNIVFNTDLFTEISTKKIQKRNTRVSKIIHIMLNKAKLPGVNRIQEKGRIVKNVNLNLVENKYRTLDLKNILSRKLNLDKLLNKTYVNYIKHNKIYPLSLTKGVQPYYISDIFLSRKNFAESEEFFNFSMIGRSGDWIWKWWKNKVYFYTRPSSIYYVLYNLVFNSIKYKNLHGIKMEVKGRLTPRYRADRSVYKVKWKGGLRDIASSYKGLPVRKNRGNLNPNVSYSIFSSKRRVGAFAVKGWTGAKYYSINSSPSLPSHPIVKYSNVIENKRIILKENKGKAGVYRWVNNLNGKSYIGSSINLSVRLHNYFNIRYLNKELKIGNSIIYRTLLKNRHKNFSLEILEYCEPSLTISNEQKYFDMLKPEYNILKIAGSNLGYKHSPQTLIKLKNRVHTLEQRVRQLEALKIVHADKDYQATRNNAIMRYNASAKRMEDIKGFSHAVEVLDTLTNIKKNYYSKAEAARAIQCTGSTITLALKEFSDKGVSRLVKKRYLITLAESNMKVKDEKPVVSNSYSVRVVIVDISTGISTTYLSLNGAAVGIGCHPSTVARAWINLKERGADSIVIKKRYKLIREKGV
uniref:Ribosomal protein S3 n=1 Tax=Juglanconis oblonga TaxID=1940568 RepID=A0A291LIR2_9PEZI|nr:ribosomal protein S3 [Juglanconis oblonga]